MGIKSKIFMNGASSEFFSCNVGVRQGENLSPFLFSMYINDLEQYLIERNVIGLQSITVPIEEELFLYLKLCVLFYADDTVILAETPDDLQIALNEFCLYCEQWKLNVNISKTKILVFSKGRMLKKEFLFNNIVLENVKEFKYLGIVFSRSGSFCKAKKHLCEQAQKAMYGVIRKIRQFNLPIDCQLDLFDKIVIPVLLYGCEIWGYENLELIERIHLKFLKFILGLKSSTPSYMVYGETGRFPLYVIIYSRMVSYWAKLFTGPENKIVYTLYKYLLSQYNNENFKNPWIECIHNILNACGSPNIWNEHGALNVKWITNLVKQRLKDQFIQKWSNDINSSSKGHTYKIFKPIFGYEKYLDILPSKFRKILVKFRTSNHRLPIETGRWLGIPLDDRRCTFCNTRQLADEMHFILECKAFSDIRKTFLNKKFCYRPNIFKFCELLSSSKLKTLKRLCMFILHIYETVCPP